MAGSVFSFLACFLYITVSVGAVKTLSTSDWGDVRQGEWMIKFFAPWCPACRNLNPVWDNFEKDAASRKLNIHVAEVDVTKQPSLAGRMTIRKLPTIYHVKDGEYREYSGDRSLNSLLDFVQKHEYERLEPLTGVWHPDGFAMIMYSYLYSISVQAKNFQDWFIDEQGYSSTLFYVVFGCAFIVVGLFLGLILVLISLCFEGLLNMIFGPKKGRGVDGRQQMAQPQVHSQPTTAAQQLPANSNDGEATNDDDEEEESDAENSNSGSASASGEEQNGGSASNGAEASVRRRNMPRKD